MEEADRRGQGAKEAAGETVPARWRELLLSRHLVLLSLLRGGVLLHSMNVLITATLLLSIVADVGGIEVMSGTLTAFLAVHRLLPLRAAGRLHQSLERSAATVSARSFTARGRSRAALPKRCLW
jgi:hypothetical protein